MRLTRIASLACCTALALMLAGATQASLEVGVTEDAGKAADGGATFFTTLTDIGLTANRVSIPWDAANPTVIQSQGEIEAWLPQALAAHTRVIFAVSPMTAKGMTGSPSALPNFVAFVRQLAQTFPMVKDYVIGNEPNQPRFWLPQFNPGSGKALAAAAYLPFLARSYDALKAVDPSITVIGIGLSPRGNDQPGAISNASRSPVRFLRELGAAYRASKRTKPLMDELAFHPYPSSSRDPITTGYVWPNAGMPNLNRIKQAVWDAFHGTAQTPFAERHKTFAKPLLFDLDEVGWQVGILPALTSFYTNAENAPTTSEATQAQVYADLIKQAACDPTVRLLNFFHLGDEVDLKTWQSGLVRADGTHRPSYDSVKNMIALTHGNCQAAPKVWSHATQVVLPFAKWGSLTKPQKSSRSRWSFPAGAGEEATFRAGIFKAGPGKAILGRRLAAGRPKPVMKASGTIKAKGRVVYFPIRKLKPGKYVYAIRMVSTMNPQRITVLVSRTFRVSAARR
jgi:hypothetical protein